MSFEPKNLKQKTSYNLIKVQQNWFKAGMFGFESRNTLKYGNTHGFQKDKIIILTAIFDFYENCTLLTSHGILCKQFCELF